jgi:AraC-like DNA-binding protein
MLTYTIGQGGSKPKQSHVHSAMQEVYGHNWDVDPVGPAGASNFRMVIKSVPFGRMNLSRASVSEAQVSNAERPSSSSADHPYNIFISNRQQKVVSRNRTVIVEPGDVSIADSASAVTIVTKEPYTTIGLTVPASMLRNYIPYPEDVIGQRFSGKTGYSKIVSYMLLTMWEHAESDDFSEIGTQLANNLLGILAACCHVNSTRPDTEDANMLAKREKIKQIINQNLHKPDLSVGDLAKLFGFSIRYIQRLFSEEECTVSSYVRRQRLEGCRKQLADPAWLHHSITEIAFNWGFNSSAHFARVFKEQYGINAREYRKQALMGLSYYKDAGI